MYIYLHAVRISLDFFYDVHVHKSKYHFALRAYMYYVTYKIVNTSNIIVSFVINPSTPECYTYITILYFKVHVCIM